MHERIHRRDAFALFTLGLAGIGVPLWLAAAAGAIGLPTNDDWVYMRGAETLFRTGSIDMPGHTAAAIGQLVMVQPLLWLSGGSPWAFTAFGLAMTLIGVASTYLLARRFVGTGSAVMVGLLVLVFPGFAREAASFMTDVPAFALTMLCLLLGTRWLQGEGRRVTLVASLTVGLLGVSIREFAIAAPIAILVVAWARNHADERAWLAAVSSIFAAGLVSVFVVARSTPGHGAPGAVDLQQLLILGPAFATLAAVLLPAAIEAMGRRLATFSPVQIIGAGLACLVLILPGRSLVGNLWASSGVAGDELLNGIRRPVIGADVWALSGQLAVFAAILVAALTLRWGLRTTAGADSLSTALALPIRVARSREAPIILFLAAYAGELAIFASVGYVFDRYLYPMVPVAAILLLRGSDQTPRLGRSQAFSHAAFAWLATSAFIIAANSFAYDVARWRAGEAAVEMGYDARTVDAGYEWVGYHSRGTGQTGTGSPAAGGESSPWYRDTLLPQPACAVLSNSPLDGDTIRLIRVNRAAYRQYLFFGPAEPLYLYGSLADDCPAAPAAVEDEAP